MVRECRKRNKGACSPTCVPTSGHQFKTYKLVYRRYAGLYFVFAVDTTDNELLYLETVHLFVEASGGFRMCLGVGTLSLESLLRTGALLRFPLAPSRS